MGNWIPVGCQASGMVVGGETLMEEQPGERSDEGETVATEGRQAGATPLESKAPTRMRRIRVCSDRGGRNGKKKELARDA